MKKSRGIFIAGNWKMNHVLLDLEAFFSEIKNQFPVQDLNQKLFQSHLLKTCLIPSYLCLEKAVSLATQLPFPLSIAAQNALGDEKGAFTGEVSGKMLKDIGVHWTLIGHSERRHIFGETLSLIHQKTEKLLNQNLNVILCIGETRAERESGKTKEILVQQIQSALAPDTQSKPYTYEKLVLAYEPVWAIGTGLTATPEQANEAHAWIRQILSDCIGEKNANPIPVLYGGSVTPANIRSLLNCPDVDGALVGGASLKATDFLALIQAGASILSQP